MTQPLSDADLLAYVDNRLPPERREIVEAWLAERPEKASEIAAWQRQNEAVTALYGRLAADAIPARLDPRLLAGRRPTVRSPRWAAIAAAAIFMLALGLGSGWLLRGALETQPGPADLLVANAVTAHALYVKENRHAVEVGADDRQHLVTWLSNRIGNAIDAPDLSAEGFELVGGRLLPAGLGEGAVPAAQFMYENAANERVTIYVTGAQGSDLPASAFTTVAGHEAFFWANAQITCTVVATLPESTMQPLARKIYQQLTRRPDYRGA